MRPRAEGGFTVIEIAIAGALLTIATVAVMGLMTSGQNNLERQVARTMSNDEIRLAAQSLDREVRSGNVIYDPGAESYAPGDVAPGMSLRVYSQTNAEPRCVQWRITADGELQRRSWQHSDPGGTVSAWRVVATGLTNRTEGIAAFSRTQANIVTVRLRANADPTARKGSDVEVTQSIAGRNTLFFSTNDVCGPASPAPLSGSGGIPPYAPEDG